MIFFQDNHQNWHFVITSYSIHYTKLYDKIYYGYVNSISPTAKKAYIGINQETVIDVEISIDNPDNDMKLGYSAKARILTKPMSNINILPYETIRNNFV